MPSLADALDPQPPAEPSACAHVTSSGRACTRPVIEGETMCVIHGASIVRTRETIYRRLLALQEKSVAVLEEIYDFADYKTQLAAVIAVLDRTDFGPKSTLQIDKKDEDLTSLTETELALRAEQAAARFRALANPLRTHEDIPVTPASVTH